MKRCPKCNRTFEENIGYCPFDNIPLADTEKDLMIGTVLDKRYKIIDKIGQGGMGKVYKAEHIILEKIFALKVLNPDLAKREDSIKRFINEAKLTSKLGHPNIVEVTDFGKTPTGSFYFVMEYVKGKTLYGLLCQNRTISQELTADILTQCADALYTAHCEGIIHRDLKPDNIMLIDKGDGSYFVKILDFGISKIAGEINTRLTSAGVIIGTPEYMSPEQASQENVDHRTDIYSLGIIMYQMLTGNLPFTSSNPLNLLMMHKTKSPKPLKSYKPDISPIFESICLKCLAKNPADRFQDMKEFMIALQDALKGKTQIHFENINTVDVSKDSIKSRRYLREIDSSTTNITSDIHPVDIPPEKIQEVRNQLFADSNSVWFDPYSKPQEPSKKETLQNNEKSSSIIIDTSIAEKEEQLELERRDINKPKSEELLLVNEIPKLKSAIPKVHIPLKERVINIKKDKEPKPIPFLTKQNIILFISSSLIISFIIGVVIYKKMTKDIEEEFKEEVKLNTPLLINPERIKHNEEKSDIQKTEDNNPKEKRDEPSAKELKIKASTARQEKPQTKLLGKPQSALDFFKEANNYFKQGKYDLAAEYYKSAIRLKPDFAMAYRGLGASYAMLGKAELSIRQYEKYIELDPNAPDIEKVIQIVNEYKNKNK